MTNKLLYEDVDDFWATARNAGQIEFSLVGVDVSAFPSSVWDGTQFVNSLAPEITDPSSVTTMTAKEVSTIRYILGVGSLGLIADEYRDSFSDVAPLHFKEIASPTTINEMVIGNANVEDSVTEGETVPDADNNRLSNGQKILDNTVTVIDNQPSSDHPDNLTDSALAIGQRGYDVILHELAHAVGLRHSNTAPPNGANYTGPEGTQQYSIMTAYTNGIGNAHPDMQDSTGLPYVWASGLQLYDIEALQSIYGRNYATRGYGDPYHFSPHTTYAAGLGFGASYSTAFIYTIWDGGGTDIINASGYAVPAEIDLRQGHFSSIGYTSTGGSTAVPFDSAGVDHGNVAIAYHTVIENAFGTGGNDTLVGNDWDNVLFGANGSDHIYADGMTYDADEGFVDVTYDDPKDPTGANDPNGAGGDNPYFWDYLPEDVLIGGSGDDTLLAGLGNDVLHGGFNATQIGSIHSGWDSANQFASLSTINPSSDGRDTADYSRLYLSISAGTQGIDVTLSGSGSVVQKGTETTGVGVDGTDHLFSIETVVGTAGDDHFSGSNEIVGGIGPLQAASWQGGAGNDTYTFDGAWDYGTIRIDDSAGTSDIVKLLHIQRFVCNMAPGTTYEQVALFTGHLGIAPAIFLDKSAIDAGNSIEYLQMNDKIFGARAFLDYAITLPQGTYTPDQMAGFIGCRIDGSTGDDLLNGFGADDALYGGAGNDTLTSFAGNDLLDGGTGADVMTGGSGNDIYIVDNAGDVANENGGEGTDTVQSSISWTLGPYIENLTLGGTSALTGTGNSSGNIITGNGAGSSLVGGLGDDIYVVHNTSDIIIENASEGTDTVQSSVTFSLASLSNVENLTLTGTSNIDGTGDSAVNVITGNSGNNSLDGGTGADTMIGGAGNDTYFVDNTLDVVSENGGSGTDAVISSVTYTLSPNVENLTLTGSASIDGTGNGSDNIITSNTGVDTLTGGDGNDTYIVNNASDVIVENSGDGTADTIQIGTSLDLSSNAMYANIENLTLTGSSNINGTGNSLDNILSSNTGVDTLAGGAGYDTYVVNNASDVLTENPGEGTDLVKSSVNWTLGSNFENLTLLGSGNINGTGNSADNVITGNTGNNTLDGGTGADVMTGGGGNDLYLVDNADDVVSGNGGGDTIKSSIAWDLSNSTRTTNVNNLTLTGSSDINGTGNSHDNTLVGNDGVNTLTGGAGNDYIDGKSGDDTMIGGTGDDTYYVQNFYDLVSESGGEGHDTVYFDGYGWDYTLASNVEDLIIVAALSATGNSLDNHIVAGTEVNTISGGAGNDTFDDAQLHTALHLLGGTGDDTYIVSDYGSSHIVENSGEGHDTARASVSWTLDSNVEDLVLTGSSNINGTGNSLDNVITGNSGNNLLDGGTGADTMSGGAGDDQYEIDNAGDVANETSGQGADLAQVNVTGFTYTLGANIETLLLGGAGAQDGVGNGLDNYIRGNLYANVLTGLAGNDSLDGFGGGDTMIGGTGDDTYVVNNAADVITESANEGTDAVQSWTNYTLSTYVENLTLLDINKSGTGNALDNVMSGIYGETLSGLGGNDTLSGGNSSVADTLIGGTGDDTYIIGSGSATPVLTENSGEGTDTVLAAKTWTLGTYFENLTLTGTSAINGTGNGLANILDGSSNTAANTLTGGDGDDTYIVGTGDVVVEGSGGSSGTDTVQVSASYTLGSNVENLTLTGSSNINGTGNSGNNVLTSNSGVDTLTGGTGNDTYILNNASDVIVENASEGTDTVQTSATLDLSSNAMYADIENLTLAGSANINGTGNSLVNVITGNVGNNTLNGGSGADSMIGGAGDDTYFIDNTGDSVTEASAEGNDTIVVSVSYTLPDNVENLVVAEGVTNLVITGNSAANIFTDGGDGTTFAGGAGDDTYYVDDADDVIIENSSEGTDTVISDISWTLGSNLEDLILTGSSNVNGVGNSLANVIISNSGVNTLTGGAGNDTYVVNNASDVIVENSSEGTDLVESTVTVALASNVENLTLTGFSDINAIGNSAVNVLTGNSGFNTLDGGSGADTMIGGAGDDTYVVDNAGDVVTENADEGTDTVQSSVTLTLGSNVENLTLTGSSNINGTGNSLDNIITSNSGVNTLTGGAGDDIYVVSNASDVVVESSGAGTDTVQSSVTFTLSSNLENLTLTGSSAINGTGNSLDNTIVSNSGVDTLTGGTGDDTYVVNNASDVVVENTSEGTDTVEASVTFAIGSNIENLTLTGISDIDGTGNSAVNVITGNSSNNTLDGGSGADTLVGDAGDDTYIVDNSSDSVTENADEGIDTVQSSVNWTLGSNVENLTLTGSSNINGTGNGLDNIITSNSGVNTLTGGDGNDTYIVSNASDVVVESTSQGTDLIEASVTFTLGSNIENLTLTGSSNINGTGNSMDNTVISNSGVDTLTGGAGDDTYVVSNASDVVVENASEGADTVEASVGFTLGSNIENLTLTGSSNINGTGNSGVNIIAGNDGNNSLDGGSGADTLIGGAGNDTYVVDNTGDVVIEASGEGTDVVQASLTWTLDSNIDNLTLTGSSNLNGTGNSLGNVLTSNTGVDTLTGGAGNDTYVVNNASDVIIENASEGTDLVQASVSMTLGSNVENLTLTGSSNLNGTGNSDVNIITGNSGDNSLDGGSGADTMIGGAGNDTYIVDNTSDTVTESSGAGTDTAQSSVSYTLGANVENLTLTGSSNINGTGNSLDNLLTSNSGVDTLTGGAGNDTYVVSNASDVLVENSSEGTDIVQASISFTLGSNVENLTLTGSSNIDATGNSLANVITSNSGVNTLTGGAGDDTYFVNNASDAVVESGSAGTDLVKSSVTFTLSSNVENLTLTGSSNIDGTGNTLANTITGNSGDNTLTGGAGDDTYLFGNGMGHDVIIESSGTDTIQFDASVTVASVIYSHSGNDLIIGYGTGTDTITVKDYFSGSANQIEQVLFADSTTHDVTYISEHANVFTGTSGDDVFGGTSSDDVMNGLGGNDTLSSFAGNDTLDGGTGNDSLNGGTGADTMIGGTGDDIFVVDNASDVVTENASEGTDSVQSSVTYTLSANVENLILTGSSNINGTGNSLDNTITSNSGVDTLTGGTGNDTYVVSNSSDVIVENSSEGTDAVQASVTYTLGSNIETLTLTGSSNINGTGNGSDNIITGNSGNNSLDGGSGTDTLIGGTGDDAYVVDTTTDVITENASEGTDTILSSVTFSLGSISNVENLTLTGSSNINGTGNSLANVLTSNSGVNTLTGGTGNDTYVVSNASDVIVENSSEGTDLVQSSVNYTLSLNVENLTLTGSSNLNGTGNSDVNVITGNSGDNTLDGGAGADTLIGGAGNDLYLIDNASDVITENSSEGTDTAQASVTYTIGSNVENLTLTGSSSLNGTGNGLDNIMTSNTGVDTLTGGAGNDTYVVSNGSDVIVENASEGTDVVQASVTFSISSMSNVENLTLTGSSNLNATGNSGVNIITGNSGNNTLDGGAGADTLIGGAGNDVYIVDNTSDVVTENASEGTDEVQSSATFTLGSNIENLTLTGSSNINGTGNGLDNIITSNSGVNTLTGGAGNDTYIVSNASDVIVENSGEGTDLVQSGITFSISSMNYVENLTLTSSSNINGTGNSLDNIITGNSGTNTLTGGAGNDTYNVSTGDVVVENSSEGTDLVNSDVTWTLGNNTENLTLTGSSAINGTGNSLDNTITGNGGANSLTGGDGNDALYGMGGVDQLNGGNGNDTLDGGSGDDALTGGAGDDLYVVDSASDTLTENNAAGTDTVQSSITFTLGANFENLTLTGSGNIDGTGNGLVNVITGNSGNNSLDGKMGADTMIGGAGNDVYIVDNASDVVTENASEGTDEIQTGMTYTLPDNVENLTQNGGGNINFTGNGLDNVITITSGSGAHTLIGNDGNDVLTGGGGGDSLDGGNGNDTLDGGGSIDTMTGGAGDDLYYVDSTSDVCTESGSGTDTVDSSVTWTLGTNFEILTLTGSTGINGTGNSADNVITGNSGANTLTGNDGADTLSGAGGNDSLTGGNGSDTLDGGTGNDTMTGGANDDFYIVDSTSDVCTESLSSGTDTVQSSVTWTLGSNFENLTLTGSSAINGIGNTGDNAITGNSGANSLSGSSGTDTLDGGDGLDSLTGGTGADTFVFHATAFNNIDVVTDYNKATDNDKLDIHDILIGYSGTVTDFVRISDSGANSIVEVDRDGTGGTYGWQQIATLNGITGLTDEAALVTSGNLIVT